MSPMVLTASGAGEEEDIWQPVDLEKICGISANH